MKKIEIVYINSENEVAARELTNFPDDATIEDIEKHCKELTEKKGFSNFYCNVYKQKVMKPVPKDRKIEICYQASGDEPNTYEIVRFPAETPDFEIDNYCYDVVSTEYGNRRWYSWKELPF